uniref:Putative secreted protein n=1 Tax=Rhipicephalus microplus TaxID=6941 RepID=A0A6G5A2W4_RHIMP
MKKGYCALLFVSLPVCMGKLANMSSYMTCFQFWLFICTCRQMLLQFGGVHLLAVYSRSVPCGTGCVVAQE